MEKRKLIFSIFSYMTNNQQITKMPIIGLFADKNFLVQKTPAIERGGAENIFTKLIHKLFFLGNAV